LKDVLFRPEEAHLSRGRGRVGSAGRPDARRGSGVDLAEPVDEEPRRRRRPSAAPTRRAGPICFASPRRSSSTCRSVDTTSSSLLVLLAPRPGAAPFPAGMSSFVRLSSRRMRCGRFGRPTPGLPHLFHSSPHSPFPCHCMYRQKQQPYRGKSEDPEGTMTRKTRTSKKAGVAGRREVISAPHLAAMPPALLAPRLPVP